jgi:hypothetical protein
MTSGSMGNVAGLLQYCVKNNYLGGASGASGIQDKLLGKKGGGASNPAAIGGAGYTSGAKGILQSGNGKSMDFRRRLERHEVEDHHEGLRHRVETG